MFEEEKKENQIEEELTGDTQTPSEEVEQQQVPDEAPIPVEDENDITIDDDVEQPMEEELNVEENIDETPEEPKMFDQNYVNDLVGRTRMEAREKAMRSLYDKYGVEDDNGLDEIFGMGQRYNILNDNYMDAQSRLSEALTENALLKSGIDPSRWDDAKFILGGKGLDITTENIASELSTHPEWMKAIATAEMVDEAQMRELSPEAAEKMASMPKANEINKNANPSQIRKFGSEVPSDTNETSEEDLIDNLFGLRR